MHSRIGVQQSKGSGCTKHDDGLPWAPVVQGKGQAKPATAQRREACFQTSLGALKSLRAVHGRFFGKINFPHVNEAIKWITGCPTFPQKYKDF